VAFICAPVEQVALALRGVFEFVHAQSRICLHAIHHLPLHTVPSTLPVIRASISNDAARNCSHSAPQQPSTGAQPPAVALSTSIQQGCRIRMVALGSGRHFKVADGTPTRTGTSRRAAQVPATWPIALLELQSSVLRRLLHCDSDVSLVPVGHVHTRPCARRCSSQVACMVCKELIDFQGAAVPMSQLAGFQHNANGRHTRAGAGKWPQLQDAAPHAPWNHGNECVSARRVSLRFARLS
jgi:hypothetical protein